MRLEKSKDTQRVIFALLACLVPVTAGERESDCVAKLLSFNKRASPSAIRDCLLADPKATVVFRFLPSVEQEAQIALSRSQSDRFRLRIVLSSNLEHSRYSPNAPAREAQLQRVAQNVHIGEAEITRQQFFEWVTQSRNAADNALTRMLFEVADSPPGHGLVILDGSLLELNITPMSMRLTISASGPADIYNRAIRTNADPFVKWMLAFLHQALELTDAKPSKE